MIAQSFLRERMQQMRANDANNNSKNRNLSSHIYGNALNRFDKHSRDKRRNHRLLNDSKQLPRELDRYPKHVVVDFRNCSTSTLKKYIQYFMLNQNQSSNESSLNGTSKNSVNQTINLDCSHSELAAIVAKHYETKLDASEEEIVPSFVEYIMAYSGGNIFEEAKKAPPSYVPVQQSTIRERRTRKRTRRVGWSESSDEENAVDDLDRNTAPSASSGNRRNNNSGNNNNNNNLGNNNDGDDDDDQGNGGTDDLYCICRKEGYGEMIACDNPKCEIEWFHIGCVNVDPKSINSRWFCPNCIRLQRQHQ